MFLLQPPPAQHQQATQSRPPLRDTSSLKRFGILKRLGRRVGQQHYSSSSTNTMSYQSSSSRHMSVTFSLNRHHRWATTSPSSSNLMQWLQTDCPQDLLPRILAFAGPRMMATISKTNRFWNDLISQERTWQMICEELYKWKEGDEIPDSWKHYYLYNPCVPVDFPSISRALSSVQNPRLVQMHSIRVLLRPGKYVLREPISVEAELNVHVTVETMEMPESLCSSIDSTFMHPKTPNKKRRKSCKLVKYLTCRTVDVVDGQSNADHEELVETTSACSSELAPCTNRAVLTLQSRRENEPILRIRQGSCTLRNLNLYHLSSGTDIWNGNAAIQIQPPVGMDDQPIPVYPAPMATMDHVDIISESGRGIVNIDGGKLTIRNSCVHDCAATGIYIGGIGSRAVIEHTDVIRNGIGNTRHRRGIARGHSGIYLEQGFAQIANCNISLNALTGISAVSPLNAILHLEESDLISNGAFQLDMPDVGSVADRQSFTRNINLARFGSIRSRSGLMRMPVDDEVY